MKKIYMHIGKSRSYEFLTLEDSYMDMWIPVDYSDEFQALVDDYSAKRTELNKARLALEEAIK